MENKNLKIFKVLKHFLYKAILFRYRKEEFHLSHDGCTIVLQNVNKYILFYIMFSLFPIKLLINFGTRLNFIERHRGLSKFLLQKKSCIESFQAFKINKLIAPCFVETFIRITYKT